MVVLLHCIKKQQQHNNNKTKTKTKNKQNKNKNRQRLTALWLTGPQKGFHCWLLLIPVGTQARCPASAANCAGALSILRFYPALHSAHQQPQLCNYSQPTTCPPASSPLHPRIHIAHQHRVNIQPSPQRLAPCRVRSWWKCPPGRISSLKELAIIRSEWLLWAICQDRQFHRKEQMTQPYSFLALFPWGALLERRFWASPSPSYTEVLWWVLGAKSAVLGEFWLGRSQVTNHWYRY